MIEILNNILYNNVENRRTYEKDIWYINDACTNNGNRLY